VQWQTERLGSTRYCTQRSRRCRRSKRREELWQRRPCCLQEPVHRHPTWSTRDRQTYRQTDWHTHISLH